MEQCIIKYVLNSYKGIPCVYQNNIILYFEELEDDDFVFNSFDLSSLYKNFLKFGDKTTIDDESYFTDVDKNKLIAIKNDYHLIMKRLKETV